MSTYREIHGKAVKSLDTDPSASTDAGQIWYNTATNTFKSIVNLQAWSSGAPFVTVRGAGASLGTQTAAVYATGYTTTVLSLSEEYNGSGWTTSPGNCNTARKDGWAGAGSQTAGLIFGGQEPGQSNKTESYNGSSWTAQGVLSTARHLIGGTGTLTAGLATGGNAEPPAPSFAGTEEFGGSSWTTGNTLNTGRQGLAACGPQTAALAYSGYTTAAVANTESYNGTSWTNVNAMAVATRMGGSAGDQTAALAYGGYGTPAPTKIGTTQSYDGTTWATSPATLATSRYCTGIPAGTSTAALALGNFPDSDPNTTEEFNSSTTAITAGAWSSGTAFPSVRWNTSGTGVATAALVFGGSTGPGAPTFLNTTFAGDGTSWTAGGTNPLSRINQFGAGTQTASISGGGYYEPGGNTTSANTYNGTSWTGITATPEATKGAGAAGTTTAALIYGSDVPSTSMNKDSYSWNGSSWSEEGALNSDFQNGGSGGPTENTAFASGSLFTPPEASTRFETYNGTAWANGPTMATTQYQNRGFGSSSAAMSVGGYNKVTTCQRFDGTAWATSPSLAVGRKQFAAANFGASGITNGWVGGGADGPSAVEEFTDESTAINVKTLTQS